MIQITTIIIIAVDVIIYSSGAGLRQLYCTSQVQQFINSNSLKDEKAIYYPGALRKVSSHFHSIEKSS